MGEPVEFAVAVDTVSPERAVVRVTGELDMSTAMHLERAIAGLPDGNSVVLDLTECTFLDSAGVRVITSCLQDGREVSLIVVDPGIRRILEITAVDTLVGIHASIDAL